MIQRRELTRDPTPESARAGRTPRIGRARTPGSAHVEPSNEYLTLEELARRTGLSVRTLRHYINLPPDQALPCYRFSARVVRVRGSDFETWALQRRTQGRPDVVVALQRDLGGA